MHKRRTQKHGGAGEKDGRAATESPPQHALKTQEVFLPDGHFFNRSHSRLARMNGPTAFGSLSRMVSFI